jgi:hypothetical protein
MAKTKQQTETRKLKYAVVRNYTLDAKLANQARDWSWSKINNELGLSKVQTKPRLKPIPKKVSSYIKSTKDYREYLEENNKLEKYKFTIKQSRKERNETWTQFSEKEEKDMPKEFKELSQKINVKRGYDPNDSYGYAVIFYAFTLDASIEEIEALMVRDRFDGDIYTFNARVR